MSGQPNLTRIQFQRLAQYWFRAEIMHQLLHAFRDELGPGLRRMTQDDLWEFDTYLQYWLSALFVTVEAFNKLQIKDPSVRRLFNENVHALKQNRHNTFHFIVSNERLSGAPNMLSYSQLNWAEELHEALGTHIAQIAKSRAVEEANVRKARPRTSPRKYKAARPTQSKRSFSSK